MAATNEKPGCLSFFFPSLKKSQRQTVTQNKGGDRIGTVAETQIEAAKKELKTIWRLSSNNSLYTGSCYPMKSEGDLKADRDIFVNDRNKVVNLGVQLPSVEIHAIK